MRLYSYRSVCSRNVISHITATLPDEAHVSATHHSGCISQAHAAIDPLALSCVRASSYATQRFGSLLAKAKPFILVKDNCKLFVLAQAGERSSVMYASVIVGEPLPLPSLALHWRELRGLSYSRNHPDSTPSRATGTDSDELTLFSIIEFSHSSRLNALPLSSSSGWAHAHRTLTKHFAS